METLQVIDWQNGWVMTLTLESATGAAAAPARMALDRAVAALLDRQHGDGRWQDDPAPDLLGEARRLAAHLRLGAPWPGRAEQAIAAIRSAQRANGAWSRFPDGGPDPAATAVCCAVLRLAGEPADSYPVAAALGWLRAAGWPPEAGWLPEADERRPVRRGLGWLAGPVARRLAPDRPAGPALAWTAHRSTGPAPTGPAATGPAATGPAATVLAATVLERAGLTADHPALAAAVAYLSRSRPAGPAPEDRGSGRGAGFATTPRVPGRESATTGRVPVRLAGDLAVLCSAGRVADPAVRIRGVALLRAQHSDGSWPGTPGCGSTLATSLVLQALLAAGVQPGAPEVRRAAGWLAGRQATDGGWSVTGDPEIGSSAVSTAAAVAGLVAVGNAGALAIAGPGVAWLAAAQRPRGDWPSADHGGRWLMEICLPVLALAGYLAPGEDSGAALAARVLATIGVLPSQPDLTTRVWGHAGSRCQRMRGL